MRRRAETRYGLLSLALLLTAALWYVSADGARTGIYFLGLYRARWFCLNLAVSYAVLWLGVHWVVALSRTGWTRIALVHTGCLVALLLAELPSVLGVIDYQALLGNATWLPARELGLRRMSQPHMRWEGEALPDLATNLGLQVEPTRLVLETDSHGLRNTSEKTNPKLVCAGDSILVARLVPVEDILTERLERLLGYEVLNISESTYGPQEAMIRVDATLPDLAGRHVVQFLFEGNDLADSVEWRAWTRAPNLGGWPKSGLVWALLNQVRWANSRSGRRRIGRFTDEERGTEDVYFLYDGPAIDRNLAEMGEISRHLVTTRDDLVARGATYSVALVPMKLTVLHRFCQWPEGSVMKELQPWTSSFPAAVRGVCEGAGIPFIDLTPELLESAESGKSPYFRFDTHLNSRGHEVLARALAAWITTR